MPEKRDYPEGGLDFLDYMFRKWPYVTSEELTVAIEHIRAGSAVEVRKVDVIFDRRGNAGRWSRYEAFHVEALSLTAEGEAFRLAGCGVYERDDWSCTSQGDHEDKAKGQVTVNILLRLSASPSPDFEVVVDESCGEFAGRLQLVKILTKLLKSWHEQRHAEPGAAPDRRGMSAFPGS